MVSPLRNNQAGEIWQIQLIRDNLKEELTTMEL